MKKINEDLVAKITYKKKRTKRHIFLDWTKYVALAPNEAVLFMSLTTRTLFQYYENLFEPDPHLLKEYHSSLKEHGMNFEGPDKKPSYIS